MVLKYFLFYVALATWYGYKRYLDLKYPYSVKDKRRKKRIYASRSKVISEVYVLTGQPKEEILKEMETFELWAVLLFSWLLVPYGICARALRMFRYCSIRITRSLR